MPALARRCWGTLETLHVVAYFAPEPAAAYEELGLRGRGGYFASRSAPMGAVAADVTVATFYVFSPALVAEHMPGAWAKASPQQVLDARHRGVAAALQRLLGKPDVTEALALARTACAALRPHGRALYAGHAALDWPADPLLALWHAASLLREHRGDAHVAALLLAGLDPVEALVTSGLTNGRTAFFKATRGWTEQDWAAAETRLRERGLLDADGALTPAGAGLRAAVEAQTDTAAELGWLALGAAGATRLLELVRPLRTTLVESGVFPASLFPRG
ncbi:MAG: hypothetical protein NVSMB13_18140 [Mycobacteriales bacterium]